MRKPHIHYEDWEKKNGTDSLEDSLMFSLKTQNIYIYIFQTKNSLVLFTQKNGKLYPQTGTKKPTHGCF